MSEEMISVVVPVYNVYPYLRRCVESIIDQTYKNLDIILVDDGSTDNSGLLCDELAEIDSRIRVIHKENGGASSARNVGIRVATGKYVGFVDSDDWIENNMYESLIVGMNDEVLISVCRSCKEEFGKKHITKVTLSEDILEITGEKAAQLLLLNKLGSSACSKLFDRRIFKEMGFPEGKTNEDFAVMYKLLLSSPKVICHNDAFYHYIKRENSCTTSKFNGKTLDGFDNATEMLAFLKENKQNLLLEGYTYWFHTTAYLVLDIFRSEEPELYNDRYRKMRSMAIAKISWLIKLKMSIKEKISILNIILFPKMYLRRHN